jgi:hypothetical protein
MAAIARGYLYKLVFNEKKVFKVEPIYHRCLHSLKGGAYNADGKTAQMYLTRRYFHELALIEYFNVTLVK